MARGAMMALLRQGIHTGRDLLMAVAANKGSSVLVPYAADLILIEHDSEELVEQIILMLEQLLGGEEPAEPVLYVKPHFGD
jgi:DNA-binding LacI/PurR family transcriptional regulator